MHKFAKLQKLPIHCLDFTFFFFSIITMEAPDNALNDMLACIANPTKIEQIEETVPLDDSPVPHHHEDNDPTDFDLDALFDESDHKYSDHKQRKRKRKKHKKHNKHKKHKKHKKRRRRSPIMSDTDSRASLSESLSESSNNRSVSPLVFPDFDEMPIEPIEPIEPRLMSREKIALLARLKRRFGPNCTQFSETMSVIELKNIEATLTYNGTAKTSVTMMRRALMFLIVITEKMSKRLPKKMNVNLDGWSESIYCDLSSFDETLYEIYDLYGENVQIHPISKLGMQLVSSAAMYSMTKQLMSSPGVRDILENPQQMQDILSNLATAMQSKPAVTAAAAAAAKPVAKSTQVAAKPVAKPAQVVVKPVAKSTMAMPMAMPDSNSLKELLRNERKVQESNDKSIILSEKKSPANNTETAEATIEL